MPIMKMVKKIPGGLMVVPLFLGMIINTLCPQILQIGGMTTATFVSGSGAFIGACLMCVGAQIDVRHLGEPLKRGIVLLVGKFLAGLIPTLLVSWIWGANGVIGITPVMMLAAITNSNGGMYLGLMAEFGDENDVGAQSLLGINDGPFLTLLGFGVAGLASLDVVSLIAAVGPMIVGVILGNVDKNIAKFLAPGQGLLIPFFAFCLGTGLNLSNIISGGATGLILSVMTIVFSLLFLFPLDKFVLRRPGYAACALCTTAGNAVAVPAILAEMDEAVAATLGTTTAAVATSVIITAIAAPIITSFAAKKFGAPGLNKEKVDEQD